MNYKLDNIEAGGTSGMDAFFEDNPQVVSPVGQAKTAAQKPPRIKVGSVAQLDGFKRISAETLINKSTNDLWAIQKDGDDFFIERLFQDDGSPLKG